MRCTGPSGLRAMRGAGHLAHLKLHRKLGGEANHLAQQVVVRGRLHHGTMAHHRIGHRGS
jgi:hypothetical protein